jgi:hypothetical protein
MYREIMVSNKVYIFKVGILGIHLLFMYNQKVQ